MLRVNFMSFRKELSFGLDVSDRSLKVMQFSRTRNQTHLGSFGEITLPEGLIDQGIIQNDAEVAGRIKEVVSKAGIASNHVVAALPEAHTFLKLVTVAKDDSPALRDQISKELQKHLPYDIEEVWWDFATVAQDETHLQILIGAAPRTLVESYRQVLIKAGLMPVLFDIESLAIARALINSGAPGQGCSMAVNIGQSKATIIMANSLTVIFTADGRSAAGELTAKIAEALSLDQNAAEEMKRKRGLVRETTEYSATVKKYADNLAQRIRGTINFAANQVRACPAVSQVLLSGGGALLAGLPEELTGQLKIPTRLADPWINTRDSIGTKVQPELGIRLVTAIGLALSALNFDHAS